MNTKKEYTRCCPHCGNLIGNEIFCPKCSNRVSHADYAIDLGLSVKWGKCNLKSDKPEDNSFGFSKYSDSAVAKEWGTGWRMPTKEEFEELIAKCKIELASINGIVGEKVTGPNGNSIFIPVYKHKEYGDFGAYFTSSIVPNKNGLVYAHVFAPGHIGQMSLANTESVLMIRPVYQAPNHKMAIEKIRTDEMTSKDIHDLSGAFIRDIPAINNFIPLRGVLLGRTNINEVKADGPVSSKTDRGDCFVSVDEKDVYFFSETGEGMRVISAYIPDIQQKSFDDWNHIGFRKDFSFDECYRFFEQNNFKVDFVGGPVICSYYEDQLVFASELKVISSDDSVCLIIRFEGDETDTPFSRNTIEQISISADVHKKHGWVVPDRIVKLWEYK